MATTLKAENKRGVIHYYTDNGYSFYGFYQKYTNTTKIIIRCLIDKEYISMSEIQDTGRLSQSEIIQMALAKIEKIEALY